MKKFLFLLLTLIFFFKFSPCWAEARVQSDDANTISTQDLNSRTENLRINYDLLYNDTPVLDFMYEDGLDKDQDSDYNRYVISPYSLIRITDTLRNKNILLHPGYYLVKAARRDGYDFLLFKQNGKVAGIIPVYQKETINPALIYKEPPKQKTPFYKSIFNLPKTIIMMPFKGMLEKRKTLVPPKSALESKVVGNGKYLEIWLYIDKDLYKVLFKIEK